MIILGIVDIYVVLFVNCFEISNNFRILSINIFLIHNYLASYFNFPRTHFLCLQTCLFNICNIIYITMPLLKIFVIVLNKKDFFYLIFYTEKNFYKDNYDKHEQQIFTNCRRQCIIFVCFLTFSTKGTLVCYVLSPLVGELFNQQIYNVNVERKEIWNFFGNEIMILLYFFRFNSLL